MTEFSILQKDLMYALNRLSQVVVNSHTMPMLQNVLFKPGAGVIALTANNLDAWETVTIPANVNPMADEAFTVNCAKLKNVVSTFPKTDNVFFVSQDKGNNANAKIVVKWNKSKFTLNTIPADEFPDASIFVDDVLGKFEVNGAVFSNALSKAIECASVDEARFALNSVLMKMTSDSNLLLCATDTHRLILDNIDIIGQSRKEDEVQALVPIPAVKKIINIANNEQRLMTVTFSNKAIEFENSASGYDDGDGVVKYTSRLISGKFPNYKRVIPDNTDGIRIKFAAERMAKAVQRMSVVRDDNHGHGIVISQDGEGDVKLEGNNNQSEDCQELVGCDDVKIPEMFGMNAKYFKTALQAFNGTVLFTGSDTESPFLMRSYDGENNIKYVLMPMRA